MKIGYALHCLDSLKLVLFWVLVIFWMHSTNYPVQLCWGVLLNILLLMVVFSSYDSMKDMCDRYNRAIDSIRQLVCLLVCLYPLAFVGLIVPVQDYFCWLNFPPYVSILHGLLDFGVWTVFNVASWRGA